MTERLLLEHSTGLRMGRRTALLSSLGLLLGCSKTSEAESEPPPPPLPPPQALPQGGLAPRSFVRRELSIPGSVSPRVVVIVPQPQDPDERFPVLIALHGRAEARKGADKGPLGWPVDYALERAVERIARPPLTPEDFFGFVRPEELSTLNRQLSTHPHRGVCVVCPYLPDLPLDKTAPQDDYGSFLVETLLPLVREKFPVLDAPQATGIDGISLGGAVALYVGTRFAESFGAVSGMQPAIGSKDADLWADRVARARERNGRQELRLLTSDKDYFLKPTRHLSGVLAARGLSARLEEWPGPHNYVFNRGPAAFAMLHYFDRVLRGTR